MKDAVTQGYEAGLKKGEALRADLEHRLREAEGEANRQRERADRAEAAWECSNQLRAEVGRLREERDAALAKLREAEAANAAAKNIENLYAAERQRADDLVAQVEERQRNSQGWQAKSEEHWKALKRAEAQLAALRAVAEAASQKALEWSPSVLTPMRNINAVAAWRNLHAALAAARAAGALEGT